MIKRRKLQSVSDTLADVNEQELAKDGDKTDISGMYDKKGAEHTNEASAPLFDVEKNRDGCPEGPVEKNISKDAGLPLPVEGVEPIADIVPCESVNNENEGEAEDSDTENDCLASSDDERGGGGRKRSDARARRGGGYIAMICICLFVSIALLLGSFYLKDTESGTDDIVLVESGDISDTSVDDKTISVPVAMSGEEIYAKNKNSVVTVAAYGDGQDRYYSGFGIFSGGYIATLYEAVADSERIEVVLSNGVAYPARLIGGDATVNLALIQCDALLDNVSIASGERSVRAGERAYAVGSMGEGRYGASFASCEISCERRTPELMGFDGYRRVFTAIQLEAINDRCMRGAPVFNKYGEAVAIVLSAGEDCLQSFALPIDGVCSILESVMHGETLSSEVLSSIAYIPPTLGILGEQVNEGDIWGVAVMGFLSESCDASLKLRVGDIIFKINDTLVPDTQALALKIQEYIPDDEVEIFVLRDGQRLSFMVKLTKNQ